jgi:EAL domain-containing protein (putative c-di-GMP-specific phosphodiesterase class I)/GGDEF domain-containing protein
LYQNDAFTQSTKVAGKDCTIAVSEQQTKYASVRFFAVFDNSAHLKTRNTMLVFRIIESAIMIIWVVIGGVYLFLPRDTLSDHKEKKSGGGITLDISRKGRIKSASSLFKKEYFASDNISKIIETPSLIFRLSKGEPILFSLTDSSGSMRHILFFVQTFFDHFHLVGSDMTDTVNEFNRLRDADINDSLTHLPIERVFREKVDNILKTSPQLKGVLAMLKLNNLQTLKMMMGENLMYQLLSLCGQILSGIFHPYGELYNMRSGNFMLFCNEEKGQKFISDINIIMEKLRKPIKYFENNIKLQPIIGIVALNIQEKGVTSDSLISNVQVALENAMGTAAGYYVMLPASFAAARTNFTATGVIQSMIAGREIEIYFQPQMSLKTGRIVSFEGLCRISGAKVSEIKISELIAIAEQYGGIIGLGNFAYNQVLAFAKEVQGSGISVSVNVSPVQLIQVGFTDGVLRSCQRFGINKGAFNIEITESMAIYSFAEVAEKLNILASSGIGVHIDDFGVAYSSFMHLKKLPVSTIKIDKGLVDDIAENLPSRTLLKNIINLAKDLGCTVIAEGVETREQVRILRQLNCDMIQGWIIGKAISYQDAVSRVVKNEIFDFDDEKTQQAEQIEGAAKSSNDNVVEAKNTLADIAKEVNDEPLIEPPALEENTQEKTNKTKPTRKSAKNSMKNKDSN